jgi:hypothetical protein
MKKRVVTLTGKLGMLIALVATQLLVPASAQRFSDWSAPVNLGAVINAGVNNQHPAISGNGLSLYYSSDAVGTLGGLDIWVSHRVDLNADWGTPQNLGPIINTAGNDLGPTFSPGGHYMYFQSDRPGGCADPNHPTPTLDIYVSHRRDAHDDFGWELPKNLGCIVNTIYDDGGPTLFRDKDLSPPQLYYTSTRPGPPGCVCGGFDIYVSTLQPDRTWGPGALVPELSGTGRDTRTAIRRDGLEMFISSDSPFGPDAVGSQDIWVSTRDTTADRWSTPVNLGPLVNSTAFDGSPALSWDAKTLYFFSERTDVQHFGKRDLYMVTRTRLRHDDKLTAEEPSPQ